MLGTIFTWVCIILLGLYSLLRSCLSQFWSFLLFTVFLGKLLQNSTNEHNLFYITGQQLMRTSAIVVPTLTLVLRCEPRSLFFLISNYLHWFQSQTNQETSNKSRSHSHKFIIKLNPWPIIYLSTVKITIYQHKPGLLSNLLLVPSNLNRYQ